ncbi:MAG: hypothetical protein D6685_06295 [Bacteroidetes bacterium]|nr:MAG: hypothetical protein D6685_06295 [Bacteroidota bacterium]
MGYSSLLYAIGAIAMGGLLLLSMYRGSGQVDAGVAAYQQQTRARANARTGLQLALRDLVERENLSTYPGRPRTSYPNAAGPDVEFQVVANTVSDTAWTDPAICAQSTTADTSRIRLTVTGYAPATGGEVTHTIHACYARETTPLLPPALRRAIYAGTDVTLSGDVQITSVDGNADVHAGQDLKAIGLNPGSSIEGYGTYGFGTSGSFGDAFAPVVDTGEDPLRQIDPVSVLAFDPDHYRDSNDAVCGGSPCGQYGPPSYPPYPLYTDAGDRTISSPMLDAVSLVAGCVDCGTREHPVTYFVDGNLTIDGTVRVDGYLHFIVTGDVTIKSNSRLVTTSDPVPPDPGADPDWIRANLDEDGETRLGIYANGAITVESGALVAAQLYGGTSVNTESGVIVIGAMATNGSFENTSSLRLFFAPAERYNLPRGLRRDVRRGVRTAAYAEWLHGTGS